MCCDRNVMQAEGQLQSASGRLTGREDGALVTRGEDMALWGELPKLRRAWVGGGEDNERVG